MCFRSDNRNEGPACAPQYYNVAKVVEPKREALRKAQNELKAAMKEKAQADATLAEVQAQVDELQRNYDQAMKEKQELEDQVRRQ